MFDNRVSFLYDSSAGESLIRILSITLGKIRKTSLASFKTLAGPGFYSPRP